MSAGRPDLIVIAGPNGSGKSTLTRSGLPEDKPVIDPDAIARSIDPDNPRSASVEAGREAIRQQRDFLERGESFAVETTLSGNRTLKVMEEAQERGYNVELHYVRLGTPEANVARVAQRVELGGHDVPREDILRRFDRSMENLPSAIAQADATQLYDNSGYRTVRVGTLEQDSYTFRENAPDWATDAAMKGARLSESQAQTEQESDRAALRYAEAAVASGVMTKDQLEDLRERVQADQDGERDGGESLKH